MDYHTNFALNLLLSSDTDFVEFKFKAEILTSENFGNVRKMFNPVYVSNICMDDCIYCGYRISNRDVKRKELTVFQSIEEVNFLTQRGVKNILILAGEYKHEKYVSMLCKQIRGIKQNTNINSLGVEIASLEISDYTKILEAGADSITIFQETYDKHRYAFLHKKGLKADYQYRLEAPERACAAGFTSVGLGILFGVNDWKNDIIALVNHAKSLQDKFPNLKLRFSFPRLKESYGQDITCQKEIVNDNQIIRSIVLLRLLFPNCDLILSGRENCNFLLSNASIVNIFGKSGTTKVGGYTTYVKENELEQFELNDDVNFTEFTEKLKTKGYAIA